MSIQVKDRNNVKSVYIVTFGAVLFLLSLLIGCTNPFAPRLAEQSESAIGLGDQRTIEGIFQNFRYSYLFKDTVVYGRLLAPDFSFIYRDYDLGIDRTWSRDEDMQSTAGLFEASSQIDLVWNDIVSAFGDSLNQNISRGFNLSITFGPSDNVRLQGRVNLLVRRALVSDPWMIVTWRDESNF